ncbi:MAG TPA: PP0621 family protein [Burkholderiaceae bacterium]|nr:PP0621 family protein [Burkholderiaceae bacterium]
MIKLLLLLAVIAIVLMWAGSGRTSRVRSKPAGREPQPEEMVQCAHCGVHLPRGEAVREGDAVFCSETHRALGVRRRSSSS